MENAFFNALKDRKKGLEENRPDFLKAASERLVRRADPEHGLIIKVKKEDISKSCFIQDLFFQYRIPKHIVSIDEKFLRHCLNMINVRAYQVSPCSISLNFNSSEMGILSECSNFPTKIPRQSTCDLTKNIIITPCPLFCHLGALDSDIKSKNASLLDVKGSFCSDLISSTINSPQKKIEREMLGYVNQIEELSDEPKSTNSLCSDQSTSCSSSSSFASVSQGMIQCTFSGKDPHFVFSINDRREVYVANLKKVETQDDKALDYMYYFFMEQGEQELVGRMKVSTSFTLNNSNKTVETEFVLFSTQENYEGELQNSGTSSRKNNKWLSKKMKERFRTSRSCRLKTNSKNSGLCVAHSSLLDTLIYSNIVENNSPPNLELAAIIVKDCVRVVEDGGWGLNFLKKTLPEKADDSFFSERITGDCSSSIDVLIPAGLHGGPRTRNGGPSSLTERWRSNGCCDCGGWDIGCPLTVLNNRSSGREVLAQIGQDLDCKTFNLFIQGSAHSVPTFRLANIRSGLYLVDFQSTLSALQCFSIAVAIIHKQELKKQETKYQG